MVPHRLHGRRQNSNGMRQIRMLGRTAALLITWSGAWRTKRHGWMSRALPLALSGSGGASIPGLNLSVR